MDTEKKELQPIEPELFAQCFAESMGPSADLFLKDPVLEELKAEADEARAEQEDDEAEELPGGNSSAEVGTEKTASDGGEDASAGNNADVHSAGSSEADSKTSRQAGIPKSDNKDGAADSEAGKADGEKKPENSSASDTGENTDDEELSGDEPEEKVQTPRLRIIFAGMDGRFSTSVLQVIAGAHQIVGIIHSKPRRRRQGLLASWAQAGKGAGNLERFAKYYGCPFFSASREYNYELLRFVKHLKPDLICISNFSIILPPDIFEIPRYGSINLHLSSLPEYRGSNPWLWMFYDGCTENEYVVHQVDAGEDTGPILSRGSYNIPPNVTCSELADCVLPNAACLMLRTIDDIALGCANPQPQPQKEGLRRARYVAPGEALINWDEWGCERTASFLQGAGIWYDPFPSFPGIVRIYQKGEKGDPKGKPGTNHWRIWHGWISCKDGIVPYRVGISRYEFWRLFLPVIILLFLLLVL